MFQRGFLESFPENVSETESGEGARSKIGVGGLKPLFESRRWSGGHFRLRGVLCHGGGCLHLSTSEGKRFGSLSFDEDSREQGEQGAKAKEGCVKGRAQSLCLRGTPNRNF